MIYKIVEFLANLMIIAFFGAILVDYIVSKAKREDDTYDVDEDGEGPNGEDIEQIFPLRYSTDEAKERKNKIEGTDVSGENDPDQKT